MLDGEGLQFVRYIFAGVEPFLELFIDCFPAEHVDRVGASVKEVTDCTRRNHVTFLLTLLDEAALLQHEVGVLDATNRLLNLLGGPNQRPRKLNRWVAPLRGAQAHGPPSGPANYVHHSPEAGREQVDVLTVHRWNEHSVGADIHVMRGSVSFVLYLLYTD